MVAEVRNVSTHTGFSVRDGKMPITKIVFILSDKSVLQSNLFLFPILTIPSITYEKDCQYINHYNIYLIIN